MAKTKLLDMCRSHGLESVTRLVEISGVSRQTLNNWNANKRELLRCVLLGAEVINRMRGKK